MKKLMVTVLFACACVGLVSASPPELPRRAPSVADTLEQLELEWGAAVKAVDVDKLNQILADDWSMLGYAGETSTKESFLANLKSGKSKLECFAIGPMDVTVLGDVAVVQGTTTERSSADGVDSSSKFIWMDVFAKRGDKWVVVRSQSGKRWFSYRAPWLA